MLHSIMQNLWELRFKTKVEHDLYPQKLVDCVVTYNYNLRWDDAEMLSKEQGSMLTDACRDSHDEDSDDNVERVEFIIGTQMKNLTLVAKLVTISLIKCY